MNSRNGAGGGLGLIILVLAVILLASGVGPSTGLGAKLIKFAGIGLAACGILILLIVIIAIIASASASKPDENSQAKADVNAAITKRKQQLAKVKSEYQVMQMETGKLRSKIAELDKSMLLCEKNAENCLAKGDEAGATEQLTRKQGYQQNKETLSNNLAEYEKNISNIGRLITDIENDIVEMQQRRDSAVTMMKIAENRQSINDLDSTMSAGDKESLEALEERARYKESYEAALRELDQGGKTDIAKLAAKYDEMEQESQPEKQQSF